MYFATSERLADGVYLIRVHPESERGRDQPGYVAVGTIVRHDDDPRTVTVKGFVPRGGVRLAAAVRAMEAEGLALGFERYEYDRVTAAAALRRGREPGSSNGG